MKRWLVLSLIALMLLMISVGVTADGPPLGDEPMKAASTVSVNPPVVLPE